MRYFFRHPFNWIRNFTGSIVVFFALVFLGLAYFIGHDAVKDAIDDLMKESFREIKDEE